MSSRIFKKPFYSSFQGNARAAYFLVYIRTFSCVNLATILYISTPAAIIGKNLYANATVNRIVRVIFFVKNVNVDFHSTVPL